MLTLLWILKNNVKTCKRVAFEEWIQATPLFRKVQVGCRRKMYSHPSNIYICIKNTAPNCLTSTAVQGKSLFWALLPGQPDAAAASPEATQSRSRPLSRQRPPAGQLFSMFCKEKLTGAETWFYANLDTFQTLGL